LIYSVVAGDGASRLLLVAIAAYAARATTSVRVPVNSGTYLKMGYVFWSISGTYFDYF